MKKLILAAAMPFAMIAVSAAAQTTVQRTVSTPAGSVTTTHTVNHTGPVQRTTVVRTTRVHETITHRHGHMVRRCATQWRHGERVRVCRTVRYPD